MTTLRPYLYVAPALIVLGLFVYWPIVYSVWLSLHRWDFLMPQAQFVGLDNYRIMLSSSQFSNALKITALFTVVSIPPMLILALVVAVLIAPPSRPNRILRSVFFTGWNTARL